MTELEKQKIKLRLNKAIGKFLDKELGKDHNIGFVPENIDSLMTEAAFSVLMLNVELNDFFENEGMLKAPEL